MGKLAQPINVRLPEPVLLCLEQQSEREGIPVSLLVRQAVMRAYPAPENGTESTTVPAQNGADGVNSEEMATDTGSAPNGASTPVSAAARGGA